MADETESPKNTAHSLRTLPLEARAPTVNAHLEVAIRASDQPSRAVMLAHARRMLGLAKAHEERDRWRAVISLITRLDGA